MKKLWNTRNGTYSGSASLKDVLTLYHGSIGQSDRHVNEDNELCIFTTIRDPITHWISGYNEVEYRIIFDVDVDDNPSLAPYTNISIDSPESRKERFRQFVKDVVRGDSAFLSSYVYLHFFPMCRILPFLDRYQVSLTGYLPSLDHLEQTFRPFLAATCPNVVPPLEEMPTMEFGGQHESSKDPLQLYRAAREVWDEGGPVARALCIIHSFDYACWELPGGVPELCQEVFSSKSFSERIHRRVQRL